MRAGKKGKEKKWIEETEPENEKAIKQRQQNVWTQNTRNK